MNDGDERQIGVLFHKAFDNSRVASPVSPFDERLSHAVMKHT